MKILFVTSPREKTVFALDYHSVLDSSNQSHSTYLIDRHPVEAPRGIKSERLVNGTQRLRVAGSRDICTIIPILRRNENGLYIKFREYDGQAIGVQNHDIYSGDKDEAVISPGSGLIPSNRLKGDRQRVETPENYDTSKSFVNTIFSRRSFTRLSLDRIGGNNENDAVIYNNKKIDFPERDRNWSAPHHICKMQGHGFVCNSRPGEIVDITNGTIFKIHGFPRGLKKLSKDTMGVLISPHRGDEQTDLSFLIILKVDAQKDVTRFEILRTIDFSNTRDLYQMAMLNIPIRS